MAADSSEPRSGTFRWEEDFRTTGRSDRSTTATDSGPTASLRSGLFPANVVTIEIVARLIFGITVLVAGLNKLLPGAAAQYAAEVSSQGSGWWYAFWGGLAESHATVFTYSVCSAEIFVGVGLLFGLLRKAVYLLGIGLGIFIWAVPEGFSGFNFVNGLFASTGLLYVVGLLVLVTLETFVGPDPLTLDGWLIRRWPRWSALSSFRGIVEPIQPPSYMLAMMPFLARERDRKRSTPRAGSPRRRSGH